MNTVMKCETWTPIAAGMSNGHILVVVGEDTLFVVTKKPLLRAGYDINAIPFSVLQKCGLNIVEKGEGKKSVLAEVMDIQRKLVETS